MIYLFVVILLLILSIHYDINGKTKYRDKWFYAVLFIMVLIAGLRWRLGVDTPAYLYDFYNRYPLLSDFSFDDYPIGKDPFYVLINSIIKSMGGRFYVVQLVQAFIVNFLIFKYIKKHCVSIFTAVLLYFVILFAGYTMEIMRGAISVAICLFGNDYILEKKWLKGYSLYALALLFHVQTVALFILPALFFLRFNRFGILVLICSFFVGKIVQASLGDYLMLLDVNGAIADKASNYADSDKFGTQIGNFIFIISNIISYLMYGILCLLYMKRYNNESKLLKLEPMLILGILFLMVQLSLQIVYRYVDYYRIYFVMFCAECFVNVVRLGNFSKGLAYIRAWVILFPFVFLLSYSKLAGKRSIRYIPYSSVIELSVSKEREKVYNTVDVGERMPVDRKYY